MHAVWNAAVKRSPDRFATVVFVTSFGGLLYIPFIPFAPLPSPDLWPWIAASAITHLFYQLCLARMMDKGALTLVYPIARGTGPMIVALFAFMFLQDDLSAAQLAAIAVLVMGIFLTARPDASNTKDNRPAIFAALATGTTIASYTIIDGLAVRKAGEALTFVIWSGMAAAPLVFLVGLKQRGTRMLASSLMVWRQGLPASFMAHGGYALALFAFSIGGLGEIAALRETSIVFATIIGTFWLKEQTGPRRIAAIGLIALSALTLKVL
jgi:drug/metabolite transporter (DMT)-like permease